MLNKLKFYEQLKQFATNKLPIYISMPINSDSKYRINLSENRITSAKKQFDTSFTIQILDMTKTGYEKYVYKDIEFNLIQENIRTDYQLYKYIENLLKEKIKE